jgi:hypothetical protein
MAAVLLQHLADGALGQPEESGEVDADDQRVVLGGVVDEWLGDEDACVVDQGVDAPEAINCLANDLVGGGLLGHVARDREDVRVLRRLDIERIRHDRPASLPVPVDEAGADSLRAARDDCYLLTGFAHGFSVLMCSCSCARGRGIARVRRELRRHPRVERQRLHDGFHLRAVPGSVHAQSASLTRQYPQPLEVSLASQLVCACGLGAFDGLAWCSRLGRWGAARAVSPGRCAISSVASKPGSAGADRPRGRGRRRPPAPAFRPEHELSSRRDIPWRSSVAERAQLHRSPPTDNGVGYLLGAGVSVGQAGQVATDEPSQLPVASGLARAGIVDRYLTRPRSSRRRVPLSLTR